MAVDRELEQTARELLDLARVAHGGGRLAEAARLVASGTLCASRANAPLLASEALRLGAVHAYAAGAVADAERGFVLAAEAARSGGDEHVALRCEASVAFIAYDRGDASTSLALLDRIDARVQAAGVHPRRRDLEALVLGYRGNIARQQGALELAGAFYRDAITRAEPGSVRTTFEMDLAAAELAAGDARAALTRVERLSADRTSTTESRPMLVPLLSHYRALARLSLGLPVEIELGDRPTLQAIRQLFWDATRGGQRRPRLERAMERRLLRLASEASDTEHARLGVRIVRALAGVPEDERSVVSRDGSAIVRRERWVELESRPSLQRVLALLAKQHVTAPDHAVTLAEIIDAGWPRERIAAAAARNRAHVALATLRTLGLADALARENGGYRLVPSRVRVI